VTYSTNVLISVFGREAKVTIESEPQVVAIEEVHGPPLGQQEALNFDRHGGLAGTAEARKPHRGAVAA